jgi:TetR/AcrR family transcriptional regulator, transcriptional repressor for nem operon
MLVMVQYDDHNLLGQQVDRPEQHMGHSQAEKAQSRERILRRAADQVRDAGLESISVGKLMRSVALTHGGFYNHFESRSDLLAQALRHALAEGRKSSLAGVDPDGPPRSFEARVRSFVSRAHRDARATGCAIAALASDVARADESSRGVMSEHIDEFVSQIAQSLHSQDEGDAMLAVSAMIGALLLARVQMDPKRSDALLKAVRERLLALNRADPD